MKCMEYVGDEVKHAKPLFWSRDDLIHSTYLDSLSVATDYDMERVFDM